MVPGEVGDQRGEYCRIADGAEVARGDGETRALAQLNEVERQDQRHAEQHQHAEQGQRRDRQQVAGPAPEQQGIQRPVGHGQQHDQVAAVERQRRQGRPTAAGDQHQQAARRQAHAPPGAALRPFAEQQAGADEGHQRQAGVDQGDVDRHGGLRRAVEHRVVAGDAQAAEHQQAPAGMAQRRAMAPQRRQHERQQQAQGQAPAPERQGQRRDLAGEGARHQGVARPAEHRQQQAERGQAARTGHRPQLWPSGRRRYWGGSCSMPLTVTLRFFQRPSLIP